MTDVEDRLAALERQVAGLVNRLAPSDAAPADAGTFWALEGLRDRIDDDATGAVLYTGIVRLAGRRFEWQYGRSVDDTLDSDWSEVAASLAALAHPVRLRLLREILGGREATAALAELDGLGTTGQLHHHLRQLTAAGWLRSTGRGRYAVPAERVVPLLAVLTAARR
ncbi:ArsR/SmtB family transcription factor [Micromonospora coxensis]|uniref:Helix-turn-helix domain-containing protein n=1 Tax=Micromonospora coxensis TaxID=356852 RepID=A0A1C5JZQ7_9ACTN|nr:helix-turn-helix domain-containing protein [Micromonospora coxensis]SCG76003.1 Helix-turn-helix domain-containing protein [Micromonospora coxensis]